MNPLELHRFGLLCVVSGPSGSGKTTLCHRLADEDEAADYAVSATTRPPREGEMDGEDYYFLSREEFEARVGNNEFLEHAEVHGNLYGTLKSEVITRLTAGHDVLIDIDVQGAELIRRHRNEMIHDAMIDVFILPPDGDALLERLRSRGTETEDQLALRLANAREEMKHWTDYQYTIISASKEKDFATFCSIVQGERCRTSRLLEQ
ncbi:MAG: guanylate kinase [Verrucomicrobiales bacterium]|nr:guanylate kinase [Verrucomicrobiales bacterium]